MEKENILYYPVLFFGLVVYEVMHKITRTSPNEAVGKVNLHEKACKKSAVIFAFITKLYLII